MTKFVAVQKLTYFDKHAPIDTYHFTMFHGLSVRRSGFKSKSHFLGDRLEDPLLLEVNAYRQTHIVQPEGRLVVSERVKEEIGPVQNLDFFPTIFTKVFVIPYSESNFSHWDDPTYYDDGQGPERVINRSPHVSELASEILPMFEVICARYVDVKDKFQDLVTVEINIGPTVHDLPFTVKLSKNMLETYPIVWHSGCHIIGEQMYDKLNKYFNWNYFIRYEGHI